MLYVVGIVVTVVAVALLAVFVKVSDEQAKERVWQQHAGEMDRLLTAAEADDEQAYKQLCSLSLKHYRNSDWLNEGQLIRFFRLQGKANAKSEYEARASDIRKKQQAWQHLSQHADIKGKIRTAVMLRASLLAVYEDGNRERFKQELGVTADELWEWIHDQLQAWAGELWLASANDREAFVRLMDLLAQTRIQHYDRGKDWMWLPTYVQKLQYPPSGEWNRRVVKYFADPSWEDFHGVDFAPNEAMRTGWTAINSGDMFTAKLVYAYSNAENGRREVGEIVRAALAAFIAGVPLDKLGLQIPDQLHDD